MTKLQFGKQETTFGKLPRRPNAVLKVAQRGMKAGMLMWPLFEYRAKNAQGRFQGGGARAGNKRPLSDGLAATMCEMCGNN